MAFFYPAFYPEYYPGSNTVYVPVIDEWGQVVFESGHVADAQSKLIQQYVDKPRMRGLLASLVARLQETEETAWDLLTRRGLEFAEGVQLDLLGATVGQPRAGLVDEDYRKTIGARIAVNVSDGRVEDLIRVLRLMFGDSAVIRVAENYPAAITIELVTGTGTLSPQLVGQMLDRAAAGGVRLRFLSTTGTPMIISSNVPGQRTNEGTISGSFA